MNIQSRELVFPGDIHKGSVVCAMDGTAHTNVREVRDGDDVQHAPDIVRCYGLSELKTCRNRFWSLDTFALELEAQLITRPTMCPIAANHVLGFYCLCLSLLVPPLR